MRDGSPAPGVLIGIEFPSGAAYAPSNRSVALTPIPLSWTPREGNYFGGAADFRRFLLEELRPKIAAHIPLNPAETIVFGYWLGGLFVIDTLLVAPESFSRYFALSPSIWFGDRSILRQLRATKALRDYRESGPDGTGTGPMVWVFTGV